MTITAKTNSAHTRTLIAKVLTLSLITVLGSACNKGSDLQTRGVEADPDTQSNYTPDTTNNYYTDTPTYSPTPIAIPTLTSTPTATATTTEPYDGYRYVSTSCQNYAGSTGYNKFPSTVRLLDSSAVVKHLKAHGSAECMDFSKIPSLDSVVFSHRFNLRGSFLIGINTSPMLVRSAAWSGVDAVGLKAYSVNFLSVQLPNALLQGAYMTNCRFDTVNLSGSNLTFATLAGTFISVTAESGATLLSSAKISGTLLNSSFKGAQAQSSRWLGITATDVNWSNADLSYSDLSTAKVKATVARPTSSTSIHFDGAKLNFANMTGFSTLGSTQKISFRGADLSFANLKGADLRQADFSKLGLRGNDAILKGIQCDAATKMPTTLTTAQKAQYTACLNP